MRSNGSSENREGAAKAGAAGSTRRGGVLRQRLVMRWKTIILVTLLLGAMGFGLGYWLESYTAQARVSFGLPHLARLEPTNSGVMATIPASAFYIQNLGSELVAPPFLEEIYKTSRFAFTPEQLRARVGVKVSEPSHTITIEAGSDQPDAAIQMATVYAQSVEQKTREFWGQFIGKQRQLLLDRAKLLEARIASCQLEARRLLAKRPDAMSDQDWQSQSREMRAADSKRSALETQLAANQSRFEVLSREFRLQSSPLAAQRKALQEALRAYTEEHPRVKALKESIEKLERQGLAENLEFSGDTGDTGDTANQWLQQIRLEVVDLRAQIAAEQKELEGLARQEAKNLASTEISNEAGIQLQSLESSLQILKQQRQELIQQIEEARFLEESGPSLNQIVALPRTESISTAAKWAEGGRFGGAGSLLGLVMSLGMVLSRPGRAHPVRSAGHLQAITGLPVLAALGDLAEVDSSRRQIWGIKSLAKLRREVQHEEEQGLVLGFASSYRGEGKSTWINLLATAARHEGFQVVLLPDRSENIRDEIPVVPTAIEPAAIPIPDRGPGLMIQREVPAAPSSQLISRRESEATIAESNAVRLAESGEKWHIATRFQEALARWQGQERVVVFVELPPCSSPESLLLAERVPHLVWVSDTTIANEEETSMQVSTLRDCGCRLIGAVMNRCREEGVGDRLRLWLTALVLLVLPARGAWGAEAPVPASPPAPVLSAPAPAPAVLSATATAKLAPWQERLTLGPGDVIEISIYDLPESRRSGVAIGPDGTLNYLQVRDFAATGFTVDELREQLEKALAKFYVAPRVVILPQAYRSKRFVLLGAVQQKGMMALDRPLTIIEAIVMGGGFESSLESQNVAMIVDLGRSFLVRKKAGGEFVRHPVDFEALFLQGDLRQNVAIEPDDYLYFPPQGIQEVYVVGEVRAPGNNPFTKDLTAMAAIAARGGYTEKAWKAKIMVIRGSLSHPQTFELNTSDILRGKAKDFVLHNRDIVYVSRKPWAYAQELLEDAVNQFMYAAVIGYAGQHVGPWIKQPIF